MAIRGDVENTSNADLVGRVLVPIEHTIAAPARYTLYHQGHGEMLDHILISRNLLAYYRGSEIHNEIAPFAQGDCSAVAQSCEVVRSATGGWRAVTCQ
jgi:hypothetical protein